MANGCSSGLNAPGPDTLPHRLDSSDRRDASWSTLPILHANRARHVLQVGLVELTSRLLALNGALLDATPDPAAARREGEALYADKPTLRGRGRGGSGDGSEKKRETGTWSDEEYAHVGLQARKPLRAVFVSHAHRSVPRRRRGSRRSKKTVLFVRARRPPQRQYLRLKSFQRFTETWALLERAAACGLFDDADEDAGTFGAGTRVVSLGGGPGFEVCRMDLLFVLGKLERQIYKLPSLSPLKT